MLDDVDSGHAKEATYVDSTPSFQDYQTPSALPHVDDIIDGGETLTCTISARRACEEVRLSYAKLPL